jgi:TolA-binding protein
VPDALLKVGETMASLGDAEGAREAYGEVVRRFAGTTAARVAEDRLAALP